MQQILKHQTHTYRGSLQKETVRHALQPTYVPLHFNKYEDCVHAL